MPAVLTDTKLCDRYVPAAWEPLLVDLQRFVALEAEARKSSSGASVGRVTELAELHDRLVARSGGLLEPRALNRLSDDEAAALFARAVLATMQIEECVAADKVLDTAGSATLPLYESDFYPSPDNRRRLHAALLKLPGITPEILKALDAQLRRDSDDARRKQAVVRALQAEFEIHADAPDLQQSVFRMFEAFYPGSGLVADEVELILTPTMIFFCLPFKNLELTTDRFAQMSVEEQEPVRAFLKHVKQFQQGQFAHFPVFGFLRGEALPDDLLRRLATAAGLKPDVVAREITRLVSIMPLAEVDKYVVHDVWGHGWQASMLRFDDLYEEIATFARPLRLDEPALSHQGRGMRFGDCFAGEGEGLRLDEAAFRAFVDGEVAERLPVAVSPVLAEIAADVVEYKLLADDPAHAAKLPSSSLFKVFPTKLDLIMQDVPFYFRQATKLFRLWAGRPKRQAATCAELVQRGAGEAAARAAVERAAALWRGYEQEDYAAKLRWQREDGRLRVNVFTRVALNFLGIHRTTLEVYRQLQETQTRALPLKGYKDLLVLAASVFFEADPPRNLWLVDEFLALRLLPLCRQLARA